MMRSTRAARLLCPVIGLIVIAGCGYSSGAGPTATPSAKPTPTTGISVRITDSDSGRTFTVATGARIKIDLAPDGGSYDPPTVDDATVLREDEHHGGYPESTTASAQLTAVAHGSAHITSQTDLPCLHTTPRCLPPQREFSVTVVVR